MSLWVDKYRPKSLSALDYHKDQANHLKNLVKDADFPHLLESGPSGAGKKTRVMFILCELYAPGVEKLRMESVNITELLKELTNNCDGTLKAAAVEEAAFFEHRAHLGDFPTS